MLHVPEIISRSIVTGTNMSVHIYVERGDCDTLFYGRAMDMGTTLRDCINTMVRPDWHRPFAIISAKQLDKSSSTKVLTDFNMDSPISESLGVFEISVRGR